MFHRITLIGFVGQDPQMRYSPMARPSPTSRWPPARSSPRSGSRTARKGWKESLNGKNWELTTWFRVTCWRKLAEA